MSGVTRALCILLVVALAAASMLAIQTTTAQPVPKPSVPEFTVNLSNSSPSLGRFTIVVTIKNQPIASQWASEFSYNVRVKSHSSQNWTNFYFQGAGPKQSSSGYTKLTYQVTATPTQINMTSNIWGPGFVWGLERDSPIDFQVEAVIMHNSIDTFPGPNLPHNNYRSIVNESGWSSTQVIALPASNSSPIPSPTVPELSWLALLPLCLIVMSVALVLKRRKLLRENQ